MTTLTKENHALENCIGHLESMEEDFKTYTKAEESDDYEKQDEIRESIHNSALSIQVRANEWQDSKNFFSDCERKDRVKPDQFNILISWGGPALRVVGGLNQYQQPEKPSLQYQDWGTPWTAHDLTEDQEHILCWWCSMFYFEVY